MNTLFFANALLPSGWARNVRLDVDPAGNFAAISADSRPDGAARVEGVAIPGMPNLHSHAFQRAMAGLTETTGAAPAKDGNQAEDSFWTWREVMYRFVGKLQPDDLRAIATQLYAEMLCSGYTAVAEFHYLHHDVDGRPYADPAEMSRAVAEAARAAGIGQTLLPVLYASGGFGGKPAGEGQRRFLHRVDDYLRLVATLERAYRDDPQIRVGIAPHSLRAVQPETLREAVVGLDAIDQDAPIHIHIAEQTKEVEDCLAWSAQRPVDWLLQHAPVGPRWCLVHATHMTGQETAALAASGAVAGLCPTTEANLGDGLFPLVAYLAANGRYGIGSDSHISVSPVEELRWLEYGQRLVTRRRNVAAQGWATGPGTATGAGLHQRALLGGAQACARPIGALGQGRRADLVVLDADHPLLVGREGEQMIDSYVFSGNAQTVRHVMVGGEWVVRDGRHRDGERIAEAYRQTVRRLSA